MLTTFISAALSLLVLVAAFFAGHDNHGRIQRSHSREISFYSYGDAMLILDEGCRDLLEHLSS